MREIEREGEREERERERERERGKERVERLVLGRDGCSTGMLIIDHSCKLKLKLNCIINNTFSVNGLPFTFL